MGPIMFPPRRILAAIDFSEPSRVALTMAARLAAHDGGELHVLHAEDPLLCAAARARGISLSVQAGDELKAFIGETGIPSTVPVQPHVIGGLAAPVICDFARHQQVDVIVVGTHGMSGAERLLFGSTAEAVLHRSRIPVLLVPPTWSPPSGGDLSGMGPVIAAIDFTGASFEAMGAAFRMARALHTSLELVHVVPSLPVIERWRPHAVDSIDQRIEEARAQLARLARGINMGMAVETRVETGPIAESIAHAARAANGRQPLLVLGRRRARTHGDVPGATAHRVVSLAHVPTLMFMATESAS
jgi:nucleotide-binding universal stress UspA family protein